MNEVECSGFEKSLTECYFNRDALGCSHEEDAGVRCNVPAMGFNSRVSTSFCRVNNENKGLYRSGGHMYPSLSSASIKWRPQSLRGPCGGPGREEWLSGVGHGVQRQLGDHGGHGGVQTARLGLRQPRFPGKGSGVNAALHVSFQHISFRMSLSLLCRLSA